MLVGWDYAVGTRVMRSLSAFLLIEGFEGVSSGVALLVVVLAVSLVMS